jgi:hypothetical protein
MSSPITISALQCDSDGSVPDVNLKRGILRVYIPFGDQTTPRDSSQYSYYYLVRIQVEITSDKVLRCLLDHM